MMPSLLRQHDADLFSPLPIRRRCHDARPQYDFTRLLFTMDDAPMPTERHVQHPEIVTLFYFTMIRFSAKTRDIADMRDRC